MARRAIFRADASPRIGTGHVRRCLAMAQALHGWNRHFIVAEESVAAVPELHRGPFGLQTLPDQAALDPAVLSSSMPDDCDLLVVDHYGIGRSYESAIRAGQTLAIDDLADRPHQCDVLVDPTPGRTPAAYRNLVPSGAAILLGGAYAPLRPAFAAARARRRNGSIGRRLFVNFGGTDPNNDTGRALDALAGMTRPAGLEVDVMMGRASAHAATVADQITGFDFVRLHLDPPEPAAIMASCDLAVGAGGVGALERCVVGLPSIVVVSAENQRLVADGIVTRGGALLAGSAAEAMRMALELIGEVEPIKHLGQAAQTVCDGRGAARIALWVDPGRTRDGLPLRLRPALASDEALIFAWQNQPGTRRYARNPHIPTGAEHHAWFAARLADLDCLFNIVLHGSEPVGVVRLDRREQGYEISISIDSTMQGRGIGSGALALARRLVPEMPLLAHVQAENIASRALFARAAYRAEGAWFVQHPSP